MMKLTIWCLTVCFLLPTAPPEDKVIEIKVQGFAASGRDDMAISMVKMNAFQNAAKYTEGFDYTYFKDEGVRITRIRTEALLKKGETPTVYRTIKLGDRSVLVCDFYIAVTEKKMEELEAVKKRARSGTFKVHVNVKNPSSILQIAMTHALNQHFEEAGVMGRVTGHGWLEEGFSMEADPTRDEKNRVKVNIKLRWTEKTEGE